ncbi:MAG: efflux RND transporter periplasmic adaptor subunit [Pseudomonadota bacterium]
MKSRKIVLVLAAVCLFGAAGYGLYRLGVSQGASSKAAVAAPAGRKVLYWHDPMMPGQKFDKPGKSPFMDMQLVPVYADGGAVDGTVSISPGVQQNLGVRTAEVTMSRSASSVVAVGSVAYNERDLVVVQARSNGFVERLFVRAPLDPVRKGQPLAELYVPDWVAAQEEYLAVQRMQGAGGAALLDGARQRMRLAGMTEAQVRIVESSGKVQARLTVSAPIGGVVTELAVREGMTVMAGAPMFRINGLSTVWVNADLPEAVSAQVRPGSAVEARAAALPGTVLKGKVSAILPEVDAATRTLKARVELSNPGQRLVPGMFATVHFAPAAGEEMLSVPTEAVIQTGKRSVVMLAQGDGRFVPVDVEVGAEGDGRTAIRSGLEAGQRIVVSGQFLIDSEASLRGAATRMREMPAAGTPAPAGNVHHGEGKVERIDKDEITLSHGAIPSLKWPAMTMGFKLPAGGLRTTPAVGDTVTFDIRQTADGGFEITALAPAAGAPKK